MLSWDKAPRLRHFREGTESMTSDIIRPEASCRHPEVAKAAWHLVVGRSLLPDLLWWAATRYILAGCRMLPGGT